MTEFVVIKDLPMGPDNYCGRDLKEGETIYRYDGCTYGCIGPKGVACSFEPGKTPFFEVARGALSLRLNGDTDTTKEPTP